MYLKQLEYFSRLAEEKNFASAANHLYLSRQGLSKCISKLETELDVRLIEHTATGIELTPAGRLFYDFSQQTLSSYQAMLPKLNDYSAEQKINIRFIVPYGFFESISMDILLSFFEKYPNLQYSFQLFSDVALVREFLKGDYDFAFSSDPVSYAQLDYYPLFRNYRCIAVNSAHPLAARQTIRAEDLRNTKIAVFDKEFFDYPFLMDYCQSAGFTPNVLAIHDTSMMADFAASGQGAKLTVAYINDAGDVRMRTNLKYIFFAEDDLERTSYDVNIVTLHGKKLSPIVLKLIRHMQDACRKLIEEQNCYPFKRP